MNASSVLPLVRVVAARPPAFTRTRLMSPKAPGLSPLFQRISARSSSSSSLVIHGMLASRSGTLGSDGSLYITGLYVPVRSFSVRGAGARATFDVSLRSGPLGPDWTPEMIDGCIQYRLLVSVSVIGLGVSFAVLVKP